MNRRNDICWRGVVRDGGAVPLIQRPALPPVKRSGGSVVPRKSPPPPTPSLPRSSLQDAGGEASPGVATPGERAPTACPRPPPRGCNPWACSDTLIGHVEQTAPVHPRVSALRQAV